MTVPLNSNGHRRRQLRARVLAEETTCALCDQPVDKTLKVEAGKHYRKCTRANCAGCLPHPQRPEVDEIIPRARGGSPLARTNTCLMHRRCNQFKGTRPLEEARQLWHQKRAEAPQKPEVSASPIW